MALPDSPRSPSQADEWQILRGHLQLPAGADGPEIPRIIHRFWTGGPMREGAFENLVASARARFHGWALILWCSADLERAWDHGLAGRAPRLPAAARALRTRQREVLRGEGYALHSIEELLSPGIARPLTPRQARQVTEAGRLATERPDAGEVCGNVKCFSDLARLMYLREHGGLHLDVDIGLGDMELDASYHHHDPSGEVPLFGALGRDTFTTPEVTEDLRAAREARREGLLDHDRLRRLCDRATLGAHAYNAVIATRPGTAHLELALHALLRDHSRGMVDLPSGIFVQRSLLGGTSEDPAVLDAAARLGVPPYLTRLDQLTGERDPRGKTTRSTGSIRDAPVAHGRQDRLDHRMSSPEGAPGAALPNPSKIADGASSVVLSRVLIVDDDQTLCEVMEMTLQRRDLEITWRTSALDALELVGSQAFDVVVTDLAMPAMSGLELCARILAICPDMPLVILSGNTSDETASAATRAGAFEVLAKPVDGRRLALTVSRAIEHRRLGGAR